MPVVYLELSTILKLVFAGVLLGIVLYSVSDDWFYERRCERAREKERRDG